MSIKKIEMFTVVCDNCGVSADEGSEYAAWSCSEGAWDVAMNSGFIIDGDSHYCQDCCSYDDDDNLVIKNKKKPMKLTQTTLDFERKGKKYSFTVFHNLRDFKLDIEAAFYNWRFRTNEFTEKSFCTYVKSKDSSIVCMNKEEMEEYSKTK